MCAGEIYRNFILKSIKEMKHLKYRIILLQFQHNLPPVKI